MSRLKLELSYSSSSSSSNGNRDNSPKLSDNSLVPMKINMRYPVVNQKEIIPAARDLGPLFARQSAKEISIIHAESYSIASMCTSSPDIRNINMNAIKTLIEKEPYNEELFKLLFCAVQVGIILHSVDVEQDLIANQKVINYVAKVDLKIGQGGYGNVYNVSVNEVAQIFALKTSISCEKEKDSIIHEFFTGFNLNKLRTSAEGVPQSPNFLYVYGLFKCFSDTSDSQNFFLCPETGQERKYFMMTEYVRGDELLRYLPVINITNLLSIYCQIIFALHNALITCDFTHYDLHVSNIMIQSLDEIGNMKGEKSQLIPYYLDDNIMLYVRANVLAKIIDYGKSHIATHVHDKINNTEAEEHFGNMLEFIAAIPGTRPLNSTPIFDLYRVTGNITYYLLTQGNLAVYHQFLLLLLRFPSVDNKARQLRFSHDVRKPYQEHIAFENFIKTQQAANWPYTSENILMEGGNKEGDNKENNNIFRITVLFITRMYPDHKIVYTENEKNDLINTRDPETTMKNAGVYRCTDNCTNAETLNQMATYHATVKKHKTDKTDI